MRNTPWSMFLWFLFSICYSIAEWGYFGNSGSNKAQQIIEATCSYKIVARTDSDNTRRFHVKESESKLYKFSRSYFLLFLFSITVSAWGYIFYLQETGYFLCESIFVQFDDEFNPDLGTFSGVYYQVKQGWGIAKNFEYADAETKHWRIVYCDSKNVWALINGDYIANRPEYWRKSPHAQSYLTT